MLCMLASAVLWMRSMCDCTAAAAQGPGAIAACGQTLQPRAGMRKRPRLLVLWVQGDWAPMCFMRIRRRRV